MTYEYRNVFCEHDFDFGDDVLRNGQIWDMMIYGEGSWCGYGGDVDISPLGDVMVSNNECCNRDGSVYEVENLTTEWCNGQKLWW